jgi:hypothetical protein
VTEQVGVISRSPRKVMMTLANDRRVYEIPIRGQFVVDADFLDEWAKANWDAEIIDLLQWPGKPATRRARAEEFPPTNPMTQIPGG